MRPSAAFAVVIGLSLAASGCDKPSDETTQGAGNGANVVGSAAPDEVTSDEVAPSGGSKEALKHVVDASHKGEDMPDKAFASIEGKPATLEQLAAGKPLLVNLWATWCAPCVAELPALDRLAARVGPEGMKVVAVSQDIEAAPVPAFWAARKLATLRTWIDPENVLGFHYGTGSLPTTILYDAQGKEILRVVGPVEWDGADGEAFIKALAQ